MAEQTVRPRYRGQSSHRRELPEARSNKRTPFHAEAQHRRQLNGRQGYRRTSGGDRDFQHTISLVREKIIGFLDIIELVPMRDQRREVNPA